jgi:hypothetical protein
VMRSSLGIMMHARQQRHHLLLLSTDALDRLLICPSVQLDGRISHYVEQTVITGHSALASTCPTTPSTK